MKYFVLTYDRTTDQVAVEPFDDDASAFAELERATLAKRPTDEVVLFYADSVDTLKRTHSRYFFTEREMIDATLAALSARAGFARITAAAYGCGPIAGSRR